MEERKNMEGVRFLIYWFGGTTIGRPYPSREKSFSVFLWVVLAITACTYAQELLHEVGHPSEHPAARRPAFLPGAAWMRGHVS